MKEVEQKSDSFRCIETAGVEAGGSGSAWRKNPSSDSVFLQMNHIVSSHKEVRNIPCHIRACAQALAYQPLHAL